MSPSQDDGLVGLRTNLTEGDAVRMSIMPALKRRTPTPPAAEPLNLTALVLVLEQTEPELTALALPGESADELAARRAAAADITDDILFGSAA